MEFLPTGEFSMGHRGADDPAGEPDQAGWVTDTSLALARRSWQGSSQGLARLSEQLGSCKVADNVVQVSRSVIVGNRFRAPEE